MGALSFMKIKDNCNGCYIAAPYFEIIKFKQKKIEKANFATDAKTPRRTAPHHNAKVSNSNKKNLKKKNPCRRQRAAPRHNAKLSNSNKKKQKFFF
jgi:hypothetical protein